MSCYMDMRIWLADLLVVLLFMQHFLIAVGLILAFISHILFVRYYRSAGTVTVDDWESIYGTEQLSYLNRIYCVVKKEIILVSVYVFFAFMYKWLVLVNDDNVITSMNIYQWSMEATFAPLVLGAAYYCSFFDDHEVALQLYAPLYRAAIMLKISVFVLMRYTETNGSFVVNDFRASLFYSVCRLFRK
jgi:hypothetical protein